MFEIIGKILIGCIIYFIGLFRGEYLEQDRAKKLVNTGKPFYTIDGVQYFLVTENHLVSNDLPAGKLKAAPYDE